MSDSHQEEMMTHASPAAARLTAWAAMIGALFALANVALVVSLTGSDQDMVLHGASMLTLASDARMQFRLAMLADILGFYLPFVVIGGYVWHAFRTEAGALGDMAAIAITLYIALGIVGAGLDLAALEPLAHFHAGGDSAAQHAAEAAWTAIAGAVQNGLWWCEGPLVLFWVLAVGRHLKQAGFRFTFLASIVAYAFGLLTLFGFFPEFGAIETLLETAVVLILPVWMLLFGWQLRRRTT